MRRRTHYLLCLFLMLTLLVAIQPVCGQADSGNGSNPAWSDQMGNKKTLVAFSGNGNYVIAGSDTGILRLYDQCGNRIWETRYPEKAVRSMAISDNANISGAVFVNEEGPSSLANGETLIFNKTGSTLWKYSEDPTVERIAISGNGNRVYVTGQRVTYVFSENGTMISRNATAGRVWDLDSARDGSYAVAASQISDNRLEAIDEDGTVAWVFLVKNGFGSVDISPDGGYVTAAGYSHMYSFESNGNQLWNYTGSSDFTSVVVSKNGEFVAAGSQYFAMLFNKSGSPLWKNEQEGFVHDIAISDNGDRIITGSSRGVSVFDRKGTIIFDYETPTAVQSLFSDNTGEVFAAGTSDSIYVFNQQGTPLCEDTVVLSANNNDLHLADKDPKTQQTTKKTPAQIGFAILGIIYAAAFVQRRK